MIIIILLILVIIVLAYLVKLLNNKVKIYEAYIIERRDAYTNLLYRIRDIDNKEMFEKDDDVGVIFSEIKSEIEEFNKIIE